MKKFSGKRVSKKTFTIFVVLAVIVFIGFLFYSFNKKSNLFEGQTTGPIAGSTQGPATYAVPELISVINDINVDTNKQILKNEILTSLNALLERLKNGTATGTHVSELLTADFIAKMESLETSNPPGVTSNPPGVTSNPPVVKKIDRWFPRTNNMMETEIGVLCPKFWSRMVGSSTMCAFNDWNEISAACNDKVEQWEKEGKGDKTYMECARAGLTKWKAAGNT